MLNLLHILQSQIKLNYFIFPYCSPRFHVVPYLVDYPVQNRKTQSHVDSPVRLHYASLVCRYSPIDFCGTYSTILSSHSDMSIQIQRKKFLLM